MDDDTFNRLIDYFDVGDLAQLIGISTKDLIEAFPDTVDNYLEDLEEIMEFKRG